MIPFVFQDVSFTYESTESPIFSEFSIEVPSGVTSLTGPNGAGKSTFLLLASGRILPTAGHILLAGQNTASLGEVEKNRLCSLVYQNMEFETEDSLGSLLEFVHTQGHLTDQDGGFRQQVVQVFELEKLLGRKTQVLSKGEMQRAVMAFSLLYGSQSVVMDEPVFALEDGQKRRALGFLSEYAQGSGRTFLYSVHELDLTRDFSTFTLLFRKSGQPLLGPTGEMLRPEVLEEAYQVPHALLHQKERLYRETLLKVPTPRDIIDREGNP